MRYTTKLAVTLALLLSAATAQAATLYIAEFSQETPLISGMQAAQTPANVLQTVAVSGTSAQSAAFSGQTRLIRVFADAAMCLLIGGSSPVATSTSMPLAANQTEYFLVVPGSKLAAITCTP